MDSKGKFKSFLVIDSETDIESTVMFAFEVGNADTITDTALAFLKEIFDSFAEYDVFSWPLNTHILYNQNKSSPMLLNKFLSISLSDRKTILLTPKDERLVSSIGHIVYVAGRWELPRQICCV